VPGIDPWKTVDEFCDERKLKKSTFYNWRSQGRGPHAYRFGKVLRIRQSDAEAFDEAHADPPRDAA
jgi:hypothetical protein